MPQISLYIDKATLSKIEELAQRSQSSISSWVGTQLKELLQDRYPEGFFDLFGNVTDPSLATPEEIPFKYDSPREHL